MIRLALHGDIPRAVEMGRRFIAETSYVGGIGENPERMAETAARLIDGLDSVLYVEEADGAIVGMIGGYVYTHPYSNERFATELFWWTDPERRGAGMRLLHAFGLWAERQGVRALQVVAPRSNDRLGAIYERLGFTRVETCYQREVTCPPV